MGLSPVHAAVTLLADSIAMMPLHVYQKRVGRVRSMDVDCAHSLDLLLHRRPNRYMTSFDLKRFLVGNLQVRGNAYVEVDWGKDGQARALYPLRSDRVTVLWRKGARLWYRVQGAGGKTYHVPQENMIHVRDFSLQSPIGGDSAIVRGKEAIGLGLALDEFAGRFFSNGAHMGGVITFPESLTAADRETYVKEFMLRRSGLAHAHEPFVLDEGGEWKSLGVSPKDAQAVEMRRYSVEEVCRIFRIPPPLLQDLTRATFNNIEQLFIQFLQMALVPLVVNIEQAFEFVLLQGAEVSTHAIKMTTDVILRADMRTRSEAYRRLVEIGALLPDEVRDLEDRNPLPGGVGRIPLQPANLVPLGTPAGTVGVAGQRPSGGVGDAAVDGDSDTRAADLYAKAQSRKGREEGKEGIDCGDQVRGEKSETRLMLRKTFEPLLAEAFLRVAQREKADLARAAEKALGKGDVAGFQALMNTFFETHPAYMKKVLETTYTQFAAGLAEEAAAQVGGDAGDIAELVGAELRSTIAQWMGESQQRLQSLWLATHDPEELLAAVKEQLAHWVETRAAFWAAERTVEMDTRIVRAVWALNGVEKIIWRTSSPCPLCKPFEGRVMGISQGFAWQGQVLEGEAEEEGKAPPRLTVKRNVYGPRLHPGCQCYLEPVLE